MTIYDSSILIDYLAGEQKPIEYVESHADNRALVPQLAMFEVYQGRAHRGPSLSPNSTPVSSSETPHSRRAVSLS